ncbi:MAG: response regulator transcription factor [Gammaproteobacteria bacterium]
MGEEEQLSIAVVDDDPSILSSLSRLLSVQGLRARTYSSAVRLLEEIDEVRPSCIVADLSMPELSGLDLQRQLEEAQDYYPIVFITGHGDVRTSVEAMRGGAVDFLTKPFENKELLEAIYRAAIKGRAARESTRQMQSIQDRLDSLTPREREVFNRVVSGLMNKQIAGEMAITEKTVKVHRARVMRKMAVRSVAELARIAEKVGMPADA